MATYDTGPHGENSRVLVIPASTRGGSLNHALARQIVSRLAHEGEDASLVDLSRYRMPRYDGDLEALSGTPAAARELAERVGSAEIIVLVSPEYNGSFSPLLKNTIDWPTRLDTAALSGVTVRLASASPGAGGGRPGLSMVAIWLANMRIDVADQRISVGAAALDEHGQIAGLDEQQLARFLAQAAPAPVLA